MTEHALHQATPEFRDYLEDEVVRAFRRERRRGLARTATIVLVSVAIGSSGGLAAAQARDSARRDSLLASAKAELAMVAVRLDLARATATDAAAKARVGVVMPTTLMAAEASLRAAEAQARRAQLNVDEIRLSSEPPRDELNAPLVVGRDFVLERIRTDLVVAQQRLGVAEQALAEAQRRQRVGAGSEIERLDAELEAARARAAFGALAERQSLRQEYHAKGTAPDQMIRRLRRTELRLDVQAAQVAVQLASERQALVKKREAVGLVDRIEVLKAELELSERQHELQLLVRQLQQVGS
jgi:hypothetical protein